MNFIYFNLFIFIHYVSSQLDTNRTIQIGIYFQDPLIYLTSPETFNSENYKNSDFGGILIEIWDKIALNLNLTYMYTLIPPGNNFSTIDVIIFNPEEYNMDTGLDPVKFYGSNYTREFYKSNEILRESYYIFFPSLLATLIQRVVWQLFFLIFIVIVPWILINAQIYYLFDMTRFKGLKYHQAFAQSLLSLFSMQKGTRCSKVYSLFFYLSTLIISMLLLADFIYAIANMLTKYDISNGFDLINTRARVCLYYYENFMIQYLQKLNSVNMFIKQDIRECFNLIENLGAEALIISEFFIRAFFKRNPSYNNVFRFFLKQQSYKTYSFFIKQDVDLSYNVSQTIDLFKSRNILQDIVQNRVDLVRYDKLSPTSILIESTILVLASLTVTSVFILIFLCVGLKRQYSKLKNRRKKNYHYSIAKNQDEKKIKSKIGISSHSEHARNKEDFKNSITYQHIMKDRKGEHSKNFNIPDHLNSELRKLNEDPNKKNFNDSHSFDPKENNNDNNFFENPNRTLSLSGSIKVVDDNNFIEPDIPLEMKRNMESIEVRSIKIEEGKSPEKF